jgi:hypothetical protein
MQEYARISGNPPDPAAIRSLLQDNILQKSPTAGTLRRVFLALPVEGTKITQS